MQDEEEEEEEEEKDEGFRGRRRRSNSRRRKGRSIKRLVIVRSDMINKTISSFFKLLQRSLQHKVIMGSSGSTPKNSQKFRRHPRRPSPQLCRAVSRLLSASAWAQAIAVEEPRMVCAPVEQTISGSEPSFGSYYDDLALANLQYYCAYDADSLPRCIHVTLCLDTHPLPTSLAANIFDQRVVPLHAC